MMLEKAAYEIRMEVARAAGKFAPFNSLHEGFAVLKEEVDELWDEIKKKSSERSIIKLREEATQVGAMAARMLVDLL